MEARLIYSYLSDPSHSSFLLFKQFEGAFALLIIAFTNVGIHAARLPGRIKTILHQPLTARAYKAEYQHTYSLSHSESTESFLIK